MLTTLAIHRKKGVEFPSKIRQAFLDTILNPPLGRSSPSSTPPNLSHSRPPLSLAQLLASRSASSITACFAVRLILVACQAAARCAWIARCQSPPPRSASQSPAPHSLRAPRRSRPTARNPRMHAARRAADCLRYKTRGTVMYEHIKLRAHPARQFVFAATLDKMQTPRQSVACFFNVGCIFFKRRRHRHAGNAIPIALPAPRIRCSSSLNPSTSSSIICAAVRYLAFHLLKGPAGSHRAAPRFRPGPGIAARSNVRESQSRTRISSERWCTKLSARRQSILLQLSRQELARRCPLQRRQSQLHA